MKWRGSSEQQVAPINRGRREGGRRDMTIFKARTADQ